ncbi:MAG: TlpA disulfide reductase family protein [Ignavibacteriaceae bacterium]|jgi:thiol-disulfide isomerase/thioredoxin
MKNIIITILLTAFSYTQVQEKPFITAPFQGGLPKELPFKWENTSYVKINSGDLFKSIYIISRDSLKTSSKCWSVVNEKEGYAVSPVVFSMDKRKECTVNLATEDNDEIAPLKLVLNLEKREISYRWENEKTDSFANPTIIRESDLKVGKTFPTIKLNSKKGEWTNKDKNKIVVINWWATTCVACKEEIPGLNMLVEKYKGRDIEFVAIISDKENLAKFLKKNPFNYLHGYSHVDLSFLFGNKFPRHIILDKNDKIIYNAAGGSKDTYQMLDGIIEKVL